RSLRERRAGIATAFAGLVLGAGVMLVRSLPALKLTGVAVQASANATGEWAEKWGSLRIALDGSYFTRLMRAGGSFASLATTDAPATGFLVGFAVAAVWLALWLLREARHGRRHAAHRFVLIATFVTLAGILLTPRAVRIHDDLNAWPLPQLVVALALRE